MDTMDAPEALAFCRSSPGAVVVTVWPTARAVADKARSWIEDCGGRVLHSQEVTIRRRGAVATMMALYHGEDWIHSNFWYGESPLPEGRPDGPYAGAKWKSALTWADAPMTCYVVDASETGGALWSSKYRVRETLRREVGGLGNCCVHLTDDQASALGTAQGGGAGGYACDSSYAFHCARVLLDASSVAFLDAADADDERFATRFAAYEAWLESGDGAAPAF